MLLYISKIRTCSLHQTDVCTIEVETKLLNLEVVCTLLLIAEETNLCYESNVVREVYLDTWLDTELVSVNIVLIVQIGRAHV